MVYAKEANSKQRGVDLLMIDLANPSGNPMDQLEVISLSCDVQMNRQQVVFHGVGKRGGFKKDLISKLVVWTRKTSDVTLFDYPSESGIGNSGEVGGSQLQGLFLRMEAIR